MTTVRRHPVKQTQLTRLGLTLIEIMIALTMTLIVLGAMMQAFQYASVEMSKGRAMMEASNQLRGAEETLQRDLNGITVDLRPYTQSAIPSGYFEYLEGPLHDNTGAIDSRGDFDNAKNVLFGYLGDIDDILAMTVRSEDRPFRGRFNGQIIESSVAEVIWFTLHNDRNGNGIIDFDESVTLYRRVLLIRPDLDLTGFISNDEFFAENDVSARVEGSRFVANALADLANRANRFCHDPTRFPHVLQRVIDPARPDLPDLVTTRVSNPELTFPSYTGDDIMLNDLCAFDVKAFSSNAMVNVIPGAKRLREQSDIGFIPRINDENNLGGFVDLGNRKDDTIRGVTPGDFSGSPTNKSQTLPFDPMAELLIYYDTWTPQYEYDGIDQDGADGIDTGLDNDGIDQGTDDEDDDGENGVDDNGERETMPPYPKPIRGLKVTLRVIEKNSKQVRQSSIVKSAVPQ